MALDLFRPSAQGLRRRFWSVSFFLAQVLVEIWFWEIILPRQLHLGFLNANPAARRQQWARDYRGFALRMGGVWIKLGQFFSSRGDILPPDITAILADLQDEVQPVPWAAVEAQIVRELERRPEEIFISIDRVPRASASLGQVHRATLPGGAPVAVKVQRPGIRSIIDVDLEALRWTLNWLKNFSFIRRRANLDALYDEFAATLRLELDYLAEGRHIEQFNENFRSDRKIYAPRPHWPLTTVRVLVLEWIDGIKITNFVGLERAGVSRAEVANRVFSSYLKQVFEDGFFHADPHPGNLFVRPLGEPREGGTGRSFELVYLDFGMVGHINERSRSLLRRMIIATVQRDYAELVRLSKELGFLLPEADNRALVAAIEMLFERYYGLSMAELTAIDYAEIEELSSRFRNLLYDFPFQIPQDFVFLGRTLSMLSGLATALDPQFSPVRGLEPYAARLLGAEVGGMVEGAAREVSELTVLLFGLPRRLDRLLRRVEDGEIVSEATQPLAERMAGIEGSINRLTDTMWLMSLSGAYAVARREEPGFARPLLVGILLTLWRLLRARR